MDVCLRAFAAGGRSFFRSGADGRAVRRSGSRARLRGWSGNRRRLRGSCGHRLGRKRERVCDGQRSTHGPQDYSGRPGVDGRGHGGGGGVCGRARGRGPIQPAGPHRLRKEWQPLRHGGRQGSQDFPAGRCHDARVRVGRRWDRRGCARERVCLALRSHHPEDHTHRHGLAAGGAVFVARSRQRNRGRGSIQ